MHQKTPVFLAKYCHNKDLNEIEPRISAKNSKSATRMADKSETRNPKFTRLRRARIRMAEILMTKTNLP